MATATSFSELNKQLKISAESLKLEFLTHAVGNELLAVTECLTTNNQQGAEKMHELAVKHLNEIRTEYEENLKETYNRAEKSKATYRGPSPLLPQVNEEAMQRAMHFSNAQSAIDLASKTIKRFILEKKK